MRYILISCQWIVKEKNVKNFVYFEKTGAGKLSKGVKYSECVVIVLAYKKISRIRNIKEDTYRPF